MQVWDQRHLQQRHCNLVERRRVAELGAVVDPKVLVDRDRMFRKGNRADNFVNTGPLPIMKGVKMSYLYEVWKR